MLENVKEKSADGQECKEPYLFNYDEQLLPSYVSNSIDHFGYFNGLSNTNLIPRITPENGSQLNIFGANRNAITSKAKAGILTRVTYPTGGYTAYDWEGHEVTGKNGYTPYAPSQAANVDRPAGGLRIASITHYAEDNVVASKRSYKYEKRNPTANASSSGILLNEPIYYTISKFTTHPEGLLGGSGECGTIQTCLRPVISATSRSSLGTIKGSHVGYSRVEETIEAGDGVNAGKVVYSYKNEAFSAAAEIKNNIENGLLERKEVFNAAGDTLAQPVYIYFEDDRTEEVFTGYQVSPIQEQNNLHLLCQESSGAYVWKLEGEDTGCAAWDVFKSKFERKNTSHHQRWIYQNEMIETRY